jgi:hypothetical protein
MEITQSTQKDLPIEWKELRIRSEEQKAMSKIPAPDSSKPLIIPGDVRAVQVISLLEDIGELGSGTHVNKLAEKTDGDVAVLLPILDAAEMLGLARSEEGELFLTDEGLKFQGTPMSRVSTLKDKLGAIEPFRTAVELASERGSTTAGEVAKTLGAQGIQWHYKPDLNESLVKNLLIHWAIRAELLSYDGKSEKFQSASLGVDPSGEGHRA